MAIKRKPQTEEKAKGLVGWKNGRQVTTSKDSTANKSVGNYKGRTLNLSKKQLGASGRRAASARTVDIGKTTFDKSKGGVLGPGGKPLTGRVDLGGGNIAVYKNGVRVRAAAAKPSGGSGGGSGGGNGGGNGGGRKMIDRGPLMQADRNPRPKPRGDSGTNRGPLLQGERKPKPVDMNAPYRSGNTKPLPGMTAKERAINKNDKARAYPSRAVKQAQDQAAERALIMASLIPGIGVATRVGMGARAGLAGMKALGAGAKAAKGAKAIGPRLPRAIEARATTGGAKISYGRPGIQKTPTGREVRGLRETGGPTARPGTSKPMTAAEKRAATRKANAAKKKKGA